MSVEIQSESSFDIVVSSLVHTIRCLQGERDELKEGRERIASELQSVLKISAEQFLALEKKYNELKQCCELAYEDLRNADDGWAKCIAQCDVLQKRVEELELEVELAASEQARKVLRKSGEELLQAEKARAESSRVSMDMTDFNFIRFGDAQYDAKWSAEKLRRARICENAHGIVTDPSNPACLATECQLSAEQEVTHAAG